jgi:6-pyruvoyltetrahydropterin/6-carboxytetrahydropterin synthase
LPYTIFKEFVFAAAHRIPDHPGKCQKLHGHNYRVRVFLRSDELDKLGMVLDFAELKALLQRIAGPFDHQVINEIPPFDVVNPTAELLSEHFYRALAAELAGRQIQVERVEVWENDSSCAMFQP